LSQKIKKCSVLLFLKALLDDNNEFNEYLLLRETLLNFVGLEKRRKKEPNLLI